MSNVIKQRFNFHEVTIFNENGEYVVVSRTSLIQNGGLLKNFIIVCPNEMKLILTLPLTLKMLNEFAGFLEKGGVIFTSADNGFEMYVIGKRYFISQMQTMCLNYLTESIFCTNICRIHDFACRHNEKQLQFHCWQNFRWFQNNYFHTDDFKRCEESTIYKLLKCSIFFTLEESDLLRALFKWVEQKFCKLRKTNDDISKGEIIRPFLTLIRFPMLEPRLIEELLKLISKDCISTKEVKSVRSYQIQKNVATLPPIVSAYAKPRRTFEYSSLTAVNSMTYEELNRNTRIKPTFLFMADFWISKSCVVNAIVLPISHRNHKGIEVLVGMKSTYSQDFVYEREICGMNGYVSFRKMKYLRDRSFNIFLLKVPKEEIKSTFIEVLKCTPEYIPIYELPDESIRLLGVKRIFNCVISPIF
ncbi:uncharacterized protein LOC111621618 isoform X1 [Centruroides sculpturatus]|uniref:uncharacterized protein LOC111621618 isoform X1 n=1 Tax=Centruroides sculpturatus TaxID=218467 RepID=UPI000C6D5F1A|nr:uncharacterized protein LOC111621618 isoform X1 [Centruroides sculpturatus]